MLDKELFDQIKPGLSSYADTPEKVFFIFKNIMIYVFVNNDAVLGSGVYQFSFRKG